MRSCLLIRFLYQTTCLYIYEQLSLYMVYVSDHVSIFMSSCLSIRFLYQTTCLYIYQQLSLYKVSEQAKEVSSRVPRHMHKGWHSMKNRCHGGSAEGKTKLCRIKKALVSSKDKRLVKTVKNDHFWSCGLTTKDASTTKTDYYPGQN